MKIILSLLAAHSVTVGTHTKLVTWSDATPDPSSLTAYSKSACSLDYRGTGAPLALVTHGAKSDGMLYTYSPTMPIALNIVNAKNEVVETQGYCNGEPELCDNTVYHSSTTTLEMTDAQGDQWTLSCTGPASTSANPPAFDLSQVDVPGVTIH